MTISDILRNIAHHGSIYGLGWVINVSIRLSLLPVWTRYLVSEQYGVISILDSCIDILRILCALGLSAAIIRFYHEYEDVKKKMQVVSTGISLLVLVSLVGGILFYFLRDIFTNILLGEGGNQKYFLITIATMLMALPRSAIDAYLNATSRSKLFVFANSGQVILNASINLLLVAGLGLGVTGMLLGNLIASILVNGGLLFYMFREMKLSFDLDIFKKLMRFSSPLIVSMIAAAAIHNSDRLFIRHFSSLSDVGLYSIAYQFPFMANTVISTSFHRVWGASSIYEIMEHDDSQYKFGRICTYYMLFSSFILFGVGFFSKTILFVFADSSYISAAIYVPILALSVWIYGFHSFLNIAVTLSKKTYLSSYVYIITFVVNILLNITLISEWGALGAAYASLITYTFLSICGRIIYKKCYPMKFEWSRLASMLVIGTVLLISRNQIVVKGFVENLFVDVSFVILYPIILYVHPLFLKHNERVKIQFVMREFLRGNF